MKRILYSIAILGISLASLFQATSAAFEETVTVAGSSFTVGTETGAGVDNNTALKFLVNLGGTVESSNLTDTINGPDFENIDSAWSDVVLVKINNSGSQLLDLVSKAVYINDPNTLRDDIYVNVMAWDDVNNNGLLEEGEEGVSYGYDTILRWRNDTFSLGSIEPESTRGFVLRFDGGGVTDANFGQSAVYDFEFTGIGL